MMPVGVLIAQEGTPEPLAGTIRAQIRVPNLSPLVGEPVPVTLIVELPPGAELVAWPELDEGWGPFAVYDLATVESEGEVEAGLRLRQQFTVRLWAPGDYETPETLVGYRLRFSDEIFFAPFTPVFFSVPSVLDQTDLVPRPLAEQVSLFYLSPWFVVLVSAGIITVMWFARRIWRRRAQVQAGSLPEETPEQIALRRLHHLNDASLSTPAIVAGVAGVVRDFIQAQYMVDAPELTTSQTVDALREKECLQDEALQEVASLLEQADLVKFAGQIPDVEVASRLLNRAYHWVRAHRNTVSEAEEAIEG